MEKIRTYDMADMTKSTRVLRNRAVRNKSTDFEWNGIYTLESLDNQNKPFTAQQSYIQGLAEKMYQKHKEWTDKKVDPLIPYLQSRTHEGTDAVTARMLTHYKNGLVTAVDIAQKVSNKIEYQDTVVSYTAGFVNMLRTCERFNVDPDLGLKLAQQSYNMRGNELAQCFTEYPELSEHVIKRAADSTNPRRILKSYIWEVKWAKRRADFEKSMREKHNLSTTDAVAEASKKSEDFYKHTMQIQLSEEGKGYTVPEGKGYKIEGVPLIEQKHGNWCGYASLSMVLQYWGYSELTPEKLYEHIMRQQYDELLERVDRSRGPSIDTLALAAKELTSLKVDLITTRHYEKLEERGLSPEDVLDAYLTKKKVPSIVRVPGHFMVATGVDNENERYIFNDPLLGGRESASAKQNFSRSWRKEDSRYKDIRDSRNMLLAIYPPK